MNQAVVCCQVINGIVKLNNSGVSKTVSGKTEKVSRPEAFLDSRSHDTASHMTEIKTGALRTAQDKTVS